MHPFYAFIWRWHFYAGIIITPILLIMAATGMIYLFQPQIEDALYGDAWYLDTPRAGEIQHDAIIEAARTHFHAQALHRYQPPHTTLDAAQLVLTTDEGKKITAIVNPETYAIRGVIDEEWRLTSLARELHGGLMLGITGKVIVETVACWTFVMIITGIYLGWTRLGGRLLPRLHLRGRNMWREWHAVAGIWASLWILAIILTGLPWSVVWGGLLDRAGQATGEGFPKEVFAARPHSLSDPALPDASMQRVMATAHAAGMQSGFAVDYPWGKDGSYGIMPLRHGQGNNTIYFAFIDRRDATLLLAINKEKLGAVGRATSLGVQFHEGRLFGTANQLLNAIAVTTLIMLSLTGWVMWLKRKPKGAFGAPRAVLPKESRRIFSGILLALCIMLPLFGASIILILLCEQMMHWREKRT